MAQLAVWARLLTLGGVVLELAVAAARVAPLQGLLLRAQVGLAGKVALRLLLAIQPKMAAVAQADRTPEVMGRTGPIPLTYILADRAEVVAALTLQRRS